MHEIRSDMVASVWTVAVSVGDAVRADDELVVLESMKMEIPVVAGRDGVVTEVRVEPGLAVGAGDVLVVLD